MNRRDYHIGGFLVNEQIFNWRDRLVSIEVYGMITNMEFAVRHVVDTQIVIVVTNQSDLGMRKDGDLPWGMVKSST